MDKSVRKRLATDKARIALDHAPQGYDALAAGTVLAARGGRALFIARDDRRADMVAQALKFFAPNVDVVRLPAWDCQPYDRVSPAASIAAERTSALRRLARNDDAAPVMIVTTAAAALQKCAPRVALAGAGLSAKPGQVVDVEALKQFLGENGYSRATQAHEPGDCAIRGGVVDIFPPGADEPVRLDFFGDTLESIRAFAPDTQRTTKQLDQVDLAPVSEIQLTPTSQARFRTGFIANFGPQPKDPLYEAVMAGTRPQGAEHLLPLFHDALETVFDYAGDKALVFMDQLAEAAVEERVKLIADYHAARVETSSAADDSAFAAPGYRALSPDSLYLNTAQWDEWLVSHPVRVFADFQDAAEKKRVDLKISQGREFAAERKTENINVFDAVADHIKSLTKKGTRVLLACWTEGSAERTATVLADHGVSANVTARDWASVTAANKGTVVKAVLPLERGFETPNVAVLSEQDILGDRLARSGRKRRATQFIAEAASLSIGDLVVHLDHGIGRYKGLKTLDIQDRRQECLELEYAGDAKLFLPVENIELLSRYGPDEGAAVLDKLGGVSWQNRKAKAKKRLRDMAAQLIELAAKRALAKSEPIVAPPGLYEEFCARFPYVETDDQLGAIDDALSDLGDDKVMDRLVCGDVGFGKTEVALRAAFAAAINGQQVAVVCPTTLLARQHHKNFVERFRGLPVKVRQLSRLVGTKEANEIKTQLAEGRVDIVVGTHALLAKSVSIKDLGLLIVDEEQHFGVRHKERLKEMKSGVNVLTLSATPIPRTLQMSLAGIRDLSIIATPPVDRLAVRTYVAPFDPVTIREALMRERYRNGHSFFVVPRIKDLPQAEEFLRDRCPELNYVVTHGQMSATELEDRITAFYEGRYDVLLSTPIVESGLDIPTANTMVIHRADLFGLAQLYQLRGRVGRSKTRAYAYMTIPATWNITPAAEKRLKVLSSLDTLGAGFTLASHDLDLRGGGNLLGEEQSGQIKDVGVELFQSMLDDAVTALKNDPMAQNEQDSWTPQINVGVSVLIPDTYVPDLDLRLGLYRRLSSLDTAQEREGFAAELIDRFGPLPEEVSNLLEVVGLKDLCRKAGIAKIDSGPKGAVMSVREVAVADPAALIAFVQRRAGQMSLRPDGSIKLTADWPDAHARLAGLKRVMTALVDDMQPQKEPA